MSTEAYEAFIAQSKSEMEKDMDPEQVDVAVSAMQKTKLLFTGASQGTILRNEVLKATATRVINGAGIPLWSVTEDNGNKWDSQEAVLTPDGDWGLVYQPVSS